MNKRKIICVDIETTNSDLETARIIQLSAVKFDPETYIIEDEFSEYIKPTGDFSISISAYCKHRISAKFLQDKPTFDKIYPKFERFIEGCDFLGYNCVRFDLPIISKEAKLIGKEFDILKLNIYDSFLEESRRNRNKLESAYQRYVGKTMEESGLQAHDALSDVKATVEVFAAQQKNLQFGYENILCSDNFINIQDFYGHTLECFNAGKYKEVPVQLVAKYDESYIMWVLNSSKISKEAKEICRKHILNIKNKQ